MQFKGLNTICTHTGALKDDQHHGAITPLYMATAYAFEGVSGNIYPRYFNTPNQQGLNLKLAALENTEAAMVFGSGMAALTTALFAFLSAGDHVIFQRTLYGGTFNLIEKEFNRFGISYSFVDGFTRGDFEREIREDTRVIFIESPSNPLLNVVDLEMISALAKDHGLVSMIDNTFASPVNQNPADFGIDLVLHSATKYLGGHSDILAGVVCGSAAHMEQVMSVARNFGGTLSDYTVWLLERSIKTLGLRVKAQNRNAKRLAKFLHRHTMVERVYYPGLKEHPDHEIAKKQMNGFGGMLSFELVPEIEVVKFIEALQLIKPVMSLGAVETTIISPVKTSHALLSAEERRQQGISERLLRLSVGIEQKKDLVEDLEQAMVVAAGLVAKD